jgi:hypothetical protein
MDTRTDLTQATSESERIEVVDKKGRAIIEELASASYLLLVGRAYGFVVTATPEALAMLRESQHPSATTILANVCPVASSVGRTLQHSPTRSKTSGSKDEINRIIRIASKTRALRDLQSARPLTARSLESKVHNEYETIEFRQRRCRAILVEVASSTE